MSPIQKANKIMGGLFLGPSYSPLHIETLDSPEAQENKYSHTSSKAGAGHFRKLAWAIVFVIWTAACLAVGLHFRSTTIASLRLPLGVAPALNVIKYQDTRIEGDFFRPSPFRGAGEAVDEAWDELWMIGGVPIRIDDSELSFLNKSTHRQWTRIPESRGGGVAGYPENMLRMATYPEQYANHTLFSDHSEDIVRAHIDHCVEILRMQLQCTAEMTPILTEEIPGHEFPGMSSRCQT
ncbi:Tat pathway signal sequence [Apiospora saccharicola]